MRVENATITPTKVNGKAFISEVNTADERADDPFSAVEVFIATLNHTAVSGERSKNWSSKGCSYYFIVNT